MSRQMTSAAKNRLFLQRNYSLHNFSHFCLNLGGSLEFLNTWFHTHTYSKHLFTHTHMMVSGHVTSNCCAVSHSVLSHSAFLVQTFCSELYFLLHSTDTRHASAVKMKRHLSAKISLIKESINRKTGKLSLNQILDTFLTFKKNEKIIRVPFFVSLHPPCFSL